MDKLYNASILSNQICCQFDFIRAAGSKYNCPWKINPQPITDSNARDRLVCTTITMVTVSITMATQSINVG